MKVYQGDPLDDQCSPHTLVEVSQGMFLEIECPELDGLSQGTKQKLRAFVRRIKREEAKNIWHIKIAKRYFTTLYPIPNLRLVGEF